MKNFTQIGGASNWCRSYTIPVSLGLYPTYFQKCVAMHCWTLAWSRHFNKSLFIFLIDFPSSNEAPFSTVWIVYDMPNSINQQVVLVRIPEVFRVNIISQV